MSGLFITSTGTEIGKTLITATLCHQARKKGLQILALKPVISGVTDQTMDGSDTAVIAEALGMPATAETWNTLSPFRFKAPLAPTMAAAKEGRTLSYGAILDHCRRALATDQFTLIEGVGGSFVPLTEGKLVADWIADLGLGSILVTGSYLGTLSHTIATLEAMTARGLKTRAIILSESAPGTLYANPDLLATAEELTELTGLRVLTVPRITGQNPWQNAPDLTSVLAAS
ncbi:MAG: dethiobiotin synthase [Alphaproteobacteria bacterium]|nr:dethiobiotin synthase [Alphaproteobacteria bacterium]